MALLTALDIPDAQRIGRVFGLEVAAVIGIPAGSVNSNYALDLARTGRRVFLRIYEEQDATAASREAALLEHLARGGVPTPRPLPRCDGPGFVAEHAGKPVAVFPWRAGEALCQRRVTPEHTERLGAALARIHLAGVGFDAPRSRFGVPQLAARIAALRERPLSAELAARVAALEVRLTELSAGPPDEGEGTGLVHGDLFRDNVLWDDRGGIDALLDFESASRGSYAYDLMVTVLAWCRGDTFEPALARALVRGYQRERPLPDAERVQLFDAARYAATRFTITRITDFELRPAGSGVHKDYRRFWARLTDLDAMGAAGLATWLGLDAFPDA